MATTSDRTFLSLSGVFFHPSSAHPRRLYTHTSTIRRFGITKNLAMPSRLMRDSTIR
jgi:hypothetical protein